MKKFWLAIVLMFALSSSINAQNVMKFNDAIMVEKNYIANSTETSERAEVEILETSNPQNDYYGLSMYWNIPGSNKIHSVFTLSNTYKHHKLSGSNIFKDELLSFIGFNPAGEGKDFKTRLYYELMSDIGSDNRVSYETVLGVSEYKNTQHYLVVHKVIADAETKKILFTTIGILSLSSDEFDKVKRLFELGIPKVTVRS